MPGLNDNLDKLTQILSRISGVTVSERLADDFQLERAISQIIDALEELKERRVWSMMNDNQKRDTLQRLRRQLRRRTMDVTAAAVVGGLLGAMAGLAGAVLFAGKWGIG